MKWPHNGVGDRGEADQIGAHLPELGRRGLVIARPGGLLGVAIGEVPAGHLSEFRRGSQVDLGGGALSRGFHEGPHKGDEYPLDSGGILGSEGCAHYARVQRVGRDRGALEPSGQLVAE